jgi:5-methyltetrahydropteroyltriglutamate--homocysteine methyltransferase
VPSTDEITRCLAHALETFAPEQLWVNPDCGLKTRAWDEVKPALANMVAAARLLRAGLQSRDASVQAESGVADFGGFANV